MGVAGSSIGATVVLEAIRSGRIEPDAVVLRAPPLGGRGFAGVSGPALVIVGSQDPLVHSINRAEARELVTVEVVEGAGHLFEEPGTLEQALEATVRWFVTHLRDAPERKQEGGL